MGKRRGLAGEPPGGRDGSEGRRASRRAPAAAARLTGPAPPGGPAPADAGSDARAGADADDAALAAQYDAYPYPARDPRDEARRLVVGSPSHLRELDWWLWGALRPQSQPLRALVAGGGTGDGAIMLATQLRDAGRPGHVLHLDRSKPASAIARARAEARGLSNIAFAIGSIEDPPSEADQAFDYVDCCGVLHHLADPAAGLASLARRLAPDGGMGLMVYAPLGRAGVYELQDALRALAPASEPPAARLEAARRLMRHLPEGAALRRNTNFDDHLRGGDAGLYDLLLNPRDRPFEIGAFAALIAGAGLDIAALIEPCRYDPLPLLGDPRLRARAADLAPLARAALAEQLSGQIATHVAYARPAVGQAVPRRDPTASDSVPVGRETDGAALAERITRDGSYPSPSGSLAPRLPLPRSAGALLRLVDGRRDVGAMRAQAAARGIRSEIFDRDWPLTFAALESANRLLLAAPP